MIVLGLAERFTGAVPDGGLAIWFGTAFLRDMGFSESHIGWGLILLGVFWAAAMSALWVRHSWGYWSVVLAAVFSMVFFPGGAAAAILTVAVLVFSRLRERLPLPASAKQ